MRPRYLFSIAALFACAGTGPAWAGPPYVTDDPEPTDLHHFEIYAFTLGTTSHDGSSGETGIDFNYGAAPDLQLTAVVPLGWSSPGGAGLGNIELAAKYKFLHQEDFGFDVAFFPRVFLPAGSPDAGERHASLLLPLWVGHSWDKWATFGGGGCVINHGDGGHNFCQLGWAIANQVTSNLQLGAEIYHATAEMTGGRATTGIGAGVIYDLNENYHLMASVGPGIENADVANQASWYVALLTTF